MKSFPALFIDDFFPDVEYVLNIAKNTEYEVKRSSATGVTSSLGLEKLDLGLHNYITEKVISIFWPPNDYIANCNLTIDFHKIDSFKSTNQTFNKGAIHCDNVFGADLTVIIYLSDHEETNVGTSFYERKQDVFLQGHTYVEDFQNALQAYNQDKEITEEREIIFNKYFDNFKETAKIQHKQNRAVIFPSNFWHGVTSFTEETRYVARLILFPSNVQCKYTNSYSINPLDRIN